MSKSNNEIHIELKIMEKVIRNGKVAVIYSPGFGAGWYTWNDDEELLFHPKLIEMIENNNQKNITKEWVKDNLGIENVCCLGAGDLKIHWLPIGTDFEVYEYDGAERITTLNQLNLKA